MTASDARPVVTDATDEFDLRARRRLALELRHQQGLARLMAERDDLHGVHAHADWVDAALRWSA